MRVDVRDDWRDGSEERSTVRVSSVSGEVLNVENETDEWTRDLIVKIMESKEDR